MKRNDQLSRAVLNDQAHKNETNYFACAFQAAFHC